MTQVAVEAQDLEQLKNAYVSQVEQNQQLAKTVGQQSSAFTGANNDNLIQWQLELDDILERVDHLLRGHELKFHDGSLIWTEPKVKTNVLFNEYGVQEILRVLSMYLNRNTILSNYDEEMINWKVYDFALEISDMIFNKYDEMFDLPDRDEENYQDVVMSKIKLYPMRVRELVDIVHSAYLRALNGGERQSLREARHVTQAINPGGVPGLAGGGMGTEIKKKFSLFKPTTWVK